MSVRTSEQSERSDVDLLRAWRQGDEASGDAFVQRLFPLIHRFFRNKAAEDLEDLVQRTLLACVESRALLPDNGALRAYILRCARNELFGWIRRKSRNPTVLPLHTPLAVICPSPTSELARTERYHVIHDALRRLPIDYQTTLELFYWEGLPVTEIATVLGVAPGTARARLTRGRRLLARSVRQSAFPALRAD